MRSECGQASGPVPSRAVQARGGRGCPGAEGPAHGQEQALPWARGGSLAWLSSSEEPPRSTPLLLGTSAVTGLEGWAGGPSLQWMGLIVRRWLVKCVWLLGWDRRRVGHVFCGLKIRFESQPSKMMCVTVLLMQRFGLFLEQLQLT